MDEEKLGFFFFWLATTFLALMTGISCTESHYKSRAIENGVAEYVIDSKTGESDFVWLSCEDSEDDNAK